MYGAHSTTQEESEWEEGEWEEIDSEWATDDAYDGDLDLEDEGEESGEEIWV